MQGAHGTPQLTVGTTNMVGYGNRTFGQRHTNLGRASYVSAGSAPSITAGAAACTNPVLSISGNDITGVVVVTTGSDRDSAGELATITFNTAYGAASRVVLTPESAQAAGLLAHQTPTATQFVLSSSKAPADETTYKFDYFVSQ